MEKIKEEDFLFGEEQLIKVFGKDYVEDLKKRDYKRYVLFRNDPTLMPSDIIYTKQSKTPKEYKNKENNFEKSTSLFDGKGEDD